MKLNKNCIFLFLFCIVLYGAFLGTIPLLDPDEPVYGETAKEMIASILGLKKNILKFM